MIIFKGQLHWKKTEKNLADSHFPRTDEDDTHSDVTVGSSAEVCAAVEEEIKIFKSTFTILSHIVFRVLF